MERYYNIHAHEPAPAGGSVCAVVNLTPAAEEAVVGQSVSYPFSAGIHPWERLRSSQLPDRLIRLRELLAHPAAVAVGECGLDGAIGVPLDAQLPVFEAMIGLSETTRKPLVVHCVRAFHLLLRMDAAYRPHRPWIVHGFRGKPALAAQLQQAGLFLSLGVRFHAALFEEADWRGCLLESDDRPPETVVRVCDSVAAAIGGTAAEVRRVTGGNALRLLPELARF